MKNISRNKIFQYTIALSMIVGLLLTCYPNWFSFPKHFNYYAAAIMLCYLGFSLLMMIIRQQNLMFLSFICCALICLYLKNMDSPLALTPVSKTTKSSTQKFSFAHLNLGMIESESAIIEEVRAADSDIISVQEIPKNLTHPLRDSLKSLYKYYHTTVDLRGFGMGLFSKKPVRWFNVMRVDSLSNLVGAINISGKESLYFASTNTFSAADQDSTEVFKNQLQKLSEFVRQQPGPVIVSGDFKAVPWSAGIKIFEQESGLRGSRQGFTGALKGNDLFKLPFNHLFYSDELHCHNFNTLSTPNPKITGVKGIYSFK